MSLFSRFRLRFLFLLTAIQFVIIQLNPFINNTAAVHGSVQDLPNYTSPSVLSPVGMEEGSRDSGCQLNRLNQPHTDTAPVDNHSVNIITIISLHFTSFHFISV